MYYVATFATESRSYYWHETNNLTSYNNEAKSSTHILAIWNSAKLYNSNKEIMKALCGANQWTGFYMISASVMIGLITDVYSTMMISCLTLSWRRLLWYRNQSTDLLGKSMDWFLYDDGLRHERVQLNLNVVV